MSMASVLLTTCVAGPGQCCGAGLIIGRARAGRQTSRLAFPALRRIVFANAIISVRERVVDGAYDPVTKLVQLVVGRSKD